MSDSRIRTGNFRSALKWHNIVAWQRLAEIVGEFVSKGSKVYVEGKLRTTSWNDRQSGEKKYRTEVVARDLVLLGSRDGGNGVQPATSHGTEGIETVEAGPGEIVDEDVPF
jgi:single-strand DNA-binding protein